MKCFCVFVFLLIASVAAVRNSKESATLLAGPEPQEQKGKEAQALCNTPAKDATLQQKARKDQKNWRDEL